MTTLCDFYSSRTTPAQIRSLGYEGASCYVSHQAGKNSTPEELRAFRADGLIVGLNFEDSATAALDGYSQGQRDGAFARDCGLALGYPHGLIFPLSVDFDAQPAQYGAIVEYFKGALAELGPYLTADYGSFNVVELLHAELGLYGWQPEAWSNGRRSKWAYLYQDHYGQQFDSDTLEFNVPLWGVTADPAKPGLPAPRAASKPSAAQQSSSFAPTIGEPVMLQFTAHGRTHLFHVENNGKLVWRSHQPDGKWAAHVLAVGARPGATPAAWSSGAIPGSADTYLQLAVELTDGKVWHGWMAPGKPWKTQLFPAM